MPHLLTAIAPEVRPVAANFLKPHEATALRDAVATMVSHGLSFVPPPAGAEGQYSSFRGAPSAYVLEPPVDKLVSFGDGVEGVKTPGAGSGPGGGQWRSRQGGQWGTGGAGGAAAAVQQGAGGKSASEYAAAVSGPNRRVLPANVRQMLAHEVRMEEIRRAEASIHGPGTPPPNGDNNAANATAANTNWGRYAGSSVQARGGDLKPLNPKCCGVTLSRRRHILYACRCFFFPLIFFLNLAAICDKRAQTTVQT